MHYYHAGGVGIRSHKPKIVKDFSVLTANTDEAKQVKTKFDELVQEKLIVLNTSADDDAHKLYSDMCAAISYAVKKALPSVPKRRRVKRKVSEKTQALYDKRSNMQGCTLYSLI